MGILEKLATVDEMAEKWGVTDRTVRNWCKSGLVEAKRFNKEWILVREQQKPERKGICND